MELLSYLVLMGKVKHDGVRYGEGELILLSVEDAKPLQASGFIGSPEQEGPAIEETRVEVPTEPAPDAYLIHLPSESSGNDMQSSGPTKQVGKVSSPGRPRKTV